MDRAVEHNDRFLVERDGEPAVLIMSVTDFVKTLAPAPDWLKNIQNDAKGELRNNMDNCCDDHLPRLRGEMV
jgi:hypothetical protein